MVLKRKTSKKSPPVFSHEFVRKNYGDIVAFILMIFMAGAFFEATKNMFGVFIYFSYGNMTEIDNVKTKLYGNGKLDLVLLLNYGIVCLVATALVNENISDKLIPALHLSMKKSWQMRHTLQNICYYLFFNVVMCIIWWDKYMNDEKFSIFQYNTNLLESFPYKGIDLYAKIVYVISLSYPLSLLANIYFWKVKSKHYIRIFSEAATMFLFFYLLYFMNFGLLGLDVASLFYFPMLLFAATEVFKMLNLNTIVITISLVVTTLSVISIAIYSIYFANLVLSHNFTSVKGGSGTVFQYVLLTFVLVINVVNMILMFNMISMSGIFSFNETPSKNVANIPAQKPVAVSSSPKKRTAKKTK